MSSTVWCICIASTKKTKQLESKKTQRYLRKKKHRWMLEAPSIIILLFNLTHLKYGHLFSVGWRNWKVMQKKKEKTEYVFRWKEDKLSFVIYVTNTLAHTPRRAFLWTDFPFISLKTTPLTEVETAACLTAITSIQYKDSVTKTHSDTVADQLYQSLSSSKRPEFIKLSIPRQI